MNVALTSDKGGVGKTTLAYHLATRYAQLGRDVALFDAERQRGAGVWVQGSQAEYPCYNVAALDAVPPHAWNLWDTQAHPTYEQRRALAAEHDLVLVVATANRFAARAAVVLARELLAFGATVRIVLNQVWPSSNDGHRTLSELAGLGLPIIPHFVRHYRCYEAACWDGRAVCAWPYANADKAWADIQAVAAAVDAILTPAQEPAHA